MQLSELLKELNDWENESQPSDTEFSPYRIRFNFFLCKNILQHVQCIQLELQTANNKFEENTSGLRKIYESPFKTQLSSTDLVLRICDYVLEKNFDYWILNPFPSQKIDFFSIRLIRTALISELLVTKDKIESFSKNLGLYKQPVEELENICNDLQNAIRSEWFAKIKPLDFSLLHLSEEDYSTKQTSVNSSESDDQDSILNKKLFQKELPHYQKVIEQINNSYRYEMYDCCGVMCRRLLEMLIIKLFQMTGNGQLIIEDGGNKKKLKQLIPILLNQYKTRLSRDTNKFNLEKIAQVGDTGAHNTERNLIKRDIDEVSLQMRNICANLLSIILDKNGKEKA